MTIPTPEYREITLTRGQVTLVDAADWHLLAVCKWQARYCEDTRRFYVIRSGYVNGRKVTFHMGRVLLGLEHGDDRKADHINHDTLDNRRLNLRIATASENMFNRGINANNKVRLKGVRASRYNGMINGYVADIRHAGRTHYLGFFPTPELAHAAYIAAAKQFYGEYYCAG